MFNSLHSCLEGISSSIPQKLILITGTPLISTNALISYYLTHSAAEKNVIFLSLQNTWSHYVNIGNKVGVNLTTKKNEGSIQILDGMQYLADISSNDISIFQNNPFDFILEESKLKNKLLGLFKIVQNYTDFYRDSPKELVIIIDSLVPLLDLGVSYHDVVLFVQYCQEILTDKPNSSVIVSSIIDESDDECSKISSHFAHTCSMCVSMRGLKTGFSKNVDGEIEVTISPQQMHLITKSKKKFHYKLLERDVKIFDIGLSVGTL